MTADLGVLLPLRLETRFKGGDLWLRVIPDEPWFVHDDPRITPTELAALQRFAAAPPEPGASVPVAWSDLASQVGPARAAYLHRTFVVVAADGTLAVRQPSPAEQRTDPVLPRIVGFPSQLGVWVDDAAGLRQVLTLTVDTGRLLADFADPDVPGDRRWWQDWDEAVGIGVAGIVPAASITQPIDALYVAGLGETEPAELLAALAADGRLGLLQPGLPTNSVDGQPAATLARDAATWWTVLHEAAGPADADVSQLLTGDPAGLGHLPGGGQDQRTAASTLVTALWPALWGFAASQVFDVTRGGAAASWAAGALYPEGAYPTLRVTAEPYGLLPTTAWSLWQADDGDPPLEAPLVRALLVLRARHAAAARARGTAAGKDTDGLLDLIADTPSSGRYRFRAAWPLELWWLAVAGTGIPARWPDVARAWDTRYGLAGELGVSPLRRYGARGQSRLASLPLVLPPGTDGTALPGLLGALADAALATPSAFASTAGIEQSALGGRGQSLLLRLAVRSVQLLIGDVERARLEVLGFDPEPFVRDPVQPGRLQALVAGAAPPAAADAGAATAQLRQVAAALRALGDVPVPELERRLRATIDASTHRIDPWLTAVPQRRLDALVAAGGLQRRLGAYGWVDAPAPGAPGPTAAGLLHAPSPSAALAAAVLRDRAVSDPSPRWQLDVTSSRARAASRIAAEVRNGAHLAEVLGREVERIVSSPQDVETLRRQLPVRTEHAGRRVCDGLQALAADPFPVTVDAAQSAALAELREAVDCYADLLVADAVHQLVQGRADAAGQVMDAAAGLARPPELGLLRTPRHGRAVSTSYALVLPHVAGAPLPALQSQRALVSPAATLDPSVAAALLAEAGPPAAWDMVVAGTATVTLAQLGLSVADALALPLAGLQRLAAEQAGLPGASVAGGSAAARYERAAALAGLIGRRPASARTFSEAPAVDGPGEPVAAELVQRYAAVRAALAALAAELGAQVGLLAADGPGTADPSAAARLLVACTSWGIAPAEPGWPARARLALPQLQARLAAAPDAPAAAQLAPSAFLDAAAALVSPTGQLGLTGAIAGTVLPSLAAAPALDAQHLTVVAAVRPALARLEAHQLAAAAPLRAWSNRAADPWQTAAGDARPLIAAYAPVGLDLGAAPALVAAAALDRFGEVVPAAVQRTGAAFGFNAPRARAQQSVLLAVPPVTSSPLDEATVVQVLVETRELAHARMARPVDLDSELWGLAPTCLLPAAGLLATPLELHS